MPLAAEQDWPSGWGTKKKGAHAIRGRKMLRRLAGGRRKKVGGGLVCSGYRWFVAVGRCRPVSGFAQFPCVRAPCCRRAARPSRSAVAACFRPPRAPASGRLKFVSLCVACAPKREKSPIEKEKNIQILRRGFVSAAGGGLGAVRPLLPAPSPARPCRKAPTPSPAASTTQANSRGKKDSTESKMNDTKIFSTIKLTEKKTSILLC